MVDTIYVAEIQKILKASVLKKSARTHKGTTRCTRNDDRRCSCRVMWAYLRVVQKIRESKTDLALDLKSEINGKLKVKVYLKNTINSFSVCSENFYLLLKIIKILRNYYCKSDTSISDLHNFSLIKLFINLFLFKQV